MPPKSDEPVVLIVDDDPKVFEGLRRRLHRHPFALVAACDGAEALRWVETHRVDVVVSDEAMPVMRGLALLSALARDYPDIIRVMMTGHARASTAIGAINRAGVYRFLLKPFNALDLAALVTEAIENRRRARAEAELVELATQQYEILRRLETTPEVRAVPPARSDVLDALDPAELALLTARERELLTHLARGRRVNDVAQLLEISRHTVRNHLRAVFNKLGVHSQQELLAKLVAPPR